MQNVNPGQIITYDDGRQNHRNVKAVVMAIIPDGFVVQFEDHADTTTIYWHEDDWIRHLTF